MDRYILQLARVTMMMMIYSIYFLSQRKMCCPVFKNNHFARLTNERTEQQMKWHRPQNEISSKRSKFLFLFFLFFLLVHSFSQLNPLLFVIDNRAQYLLFAVRCCDNVLRYILAIWIFPYILNSEKFVPCLKYRVIWFSFEIL